MTINDLFAGAIEMLVRIAWAFERTFILVMERNFGDLVLADLVIIIIIGGPVLLLASVGVMLVFAALEEFFSPGPPPRDDP